MDRVKAPIYYTAPVKEHSWAKAGLWNGPLSVKTEHFIETRGKQFMKMKWILNQFRLFDSEFKIPIEKIE